ncbi:MAG: SET domain-containing protein-lysine N-methyltransferase [Rhizobacter sp.]
MPQLRDAPPQPVAAPAPAPAPAGRPAYQKFAVAVRPSRIDGQGAFAAEPVPARLKIGEIRGESISVETARIRATRTERVMIVELSEKKAIDFSKSADPMRYTNHSCQPNARLCIRQGRVEFYALRAIAPGEEITVNYGETHHEGRLACRCGAPGCVGRL